MFKINCFFHPSFLQLLSPQKNHVHILHPQIVLDLHMVSLVKDQFCLEREGLMNR